MTGGVLALGAVVLVGSQIGLTNQVQSISSQEQVLGFIVNPLTPCVLRGYDPARPGGLARLTS